MRGMFEHRQTSECFEAVNRKTKASGDKLKQTSSPVVVKLSHCPPEPLNDRRLGAASPQSCVTLPVLNIDLTDSTHHDLSRTWPLH